MGSRLTAEKRSVAASDGVEIEYEVLGAGPPILLVHGGFAGRSTFSPRPWNRQQLRMLLAEETKDRGIHAIRLVSVDVVARTFSDDHM